MSNSAVDFRTEGTDNIQRGSETTEVCRQNNMIFRTAKEPFTDNRDVCPSFEQRRRCIGKDCQWNVQSRETSARSPLSAPACDWDVEKRSTLVRSAEAMLEHILDRSHVGGLGGLHWLLQQETQTFSDLPVCHCHGAHIECVVASCLFFSAGRLSNRSVILRELSWTGDLCSVTESYDAPSWHDEIDIDPRNATPSRVAMDKFIPNVDLSKSQIECSRGSCCRAVFPGSGTRSSRGDRASPSRRNPRRYWGFRVRIDTDVGSSTAAGDRFTSVQKMNSTEWRKITSLDRRLSESVIRSDESATPHIVVSPTNNMDIRAWLDVSLLPPYRRSRVREEVSFPSRAQRVSKYFIANDIVLPISYPWPWKNRVVEEVHEEEVLLEGASASSKELRSRRSRRSLNSLGASFPRR